MRISQLSSGTRSAVTAYYDRSPESQDGRFVAWSEFVDAIPITYYRSVRS